MGRGTDPGSGRTGPPPFLSGGRPGSKPGRLGFEPRLERERPSKGSSRESSSSAAARPTRIARHAGASQAREALHEALAVARREEETQEDACEGWTDARAQIRSDAAERGGGRKHEGFDTTTCERAGAED